jgi:hypothetical protein
MILIFMFLKNHTSVKLLFLMLKINLESILLFQDSLMIKVLELMGAESEDQQLHTYLEKHLYNNNYTENQI